MALRTPRSNPTSAGAAIIKLRIVYAIVRAAWWVVCQSANKFALSPTRPLLYTVNRHYAEYAGYWETTTFLADADKAIRNGDKMTFYDSNTGKPLFRGPVQRSWQDFLKESRSHGWPSFRDEEVVWENVRVLPNGETVSVDGTHLGHNLPDQKGRRYCINLVSIAGRDSKNVQ